MKHLLRRSLYDVKSRFNTDKLGTDICLLLIILGMFVMTATVL